MLARSLCASWPLLRSLGPPNLIIYNYSCAEHDEEDRLEAPLRRYTTPPSPSPSPPPPLPRILTTSKRNEMRYITSPSSLARSLAHSICARASYTLDLCQAGRPRTIPNPAYLRSSLKIALTQSELFQVTMLFLITKNDEKRHR